MILKSVTLNNFRNFKEKKFTFGEGITLIVGENSKGKTNLIESLHVLCMGKGLKNEKQEELITFNEKVASIVGEFSEENYSTKYRIYLEKNLILKKTYHIDNTKKILAHYLKLTPPAILFSPELMSIISGEPSERRSFIDNILERVDIEYKKRLHNYYAGLRKRNKIYEHENDRTKLHELLDFWNHYLIEQGEYIQEKREWICAMINEHPHLSTHSFSIEYLKNHISVTRFEEYSDKEYYQKRTLIGPQRDDFCFYKLSNQNGSSINVHKYCSRGEQRLALFWLIFNSIEILKNLIKKNPIVLLDDIFSELDEANKTIVFERIKDYQTIISTTEEEFASHFKEKAQIIKIG